MDQNPSSQKPTLRTTNQLSNRDLWLLRGPRLWAELHQWALRGDIAGGKEWLKHFTQRIPCGECKRHWIELQKKLPPNFSSRHSLFNWTVAAHNAVNRRLGKPEIAEDTALAHVFWMMEELSSKTTATSIRRPPELNSAATMRPKPLGAGALRIPRPLQINTLPVNCRNAAKTNRPTFVTCSLGLYGGNPHVAICRQCPKRDPKYSDSKQLTQTAEPVILAPKPSQSGGLAKRNDVRGDASTLIPVNCICATKTDRPTSVVCSLGLYGGKPHIAICRDCPKRIPRNTELSQAIWMPAKPSPILLQRLREPFPTNIDQSYLPRVVPKIDFPIDIVYLWVDGSDPEFQKSLAMHSPNASPNTARFTNADELRYSLRSVDRFAPWINRVFLVTNGQVPTWLHLSHPKITLILHSQIINAKHLPTFNSAAIECNIHRIPELAEHFLFANDDMMFGAPVYPGDFFTPDGKAIIFLTGGGIRSSNGGIYNAMKNNAAAILDAQFGQKDRRRGWHHVKPYTRAMFSDLDKRIPDAIECSSSHKRRQSKDIAWNCALWPSFALEAGYGVRASGDQLLRAKYINVGGRYAREQMNEAIKRMPNLLCINNATPKNAGLAREFLQAYLPTMSTFEKLQHFTISGKFGDAIYAMATLKHLGGGRLHYWPHFRGSYKNAEVFINNIDSLLKLQPYVSGLHASTMLVGHNFDRWRYFTWKEKGDRLADVHARAVGAKHVNYDDPWINPGEPDRRARVVINRSARYHNQRFPWARVLQKYAGEIAFVGMKAEYGAFRRTFGGLPWIVTKDCLQLARIIAGADLFVGNQSLCFALAIAMGVPVVQETFPENADCIFLRPNAIYGFDESVELPELK